MVSGTFAKLGVPLHKGSQEKSGIGSRPARRLAKRSRCERSRSAAHSGALLRTWPERSGRAGGKVGGWAAAKLPMPNVCKGKPKGDVFLPWLFFRKNQAFGRCKPSTRPQSVVFNHLLLAANSKIVFFVCVTFQGQIVYVFV